MIRYVGFFRYLAYSIEILLMFILGATPRLLPDIFGAKPCLLIACAITIAVFEREIPSMIFGFLCGALTDFGYSNAIGAYTIAMVFVCFVLGYCANNLIMANVWNVMLSSLVAVFAVISVHFLVSYVMVGLPDAGMYFVDHYLSRILQTFVVTVLFYFLNKFIYSLLSEEMQA